MDDRERALAISSALNSGVTRGVEVIVGSGGNIMVNCGDKPNSKWLANEVVAKLHGQGFSTAWCPSPAASWASYIVVVTAQDPRFAY